MEYDKIFIKPLITNCFVSLFLLYISVSLFLGSNPFGSEKLNTSNLMVKIFERLLIPIAILVLSFWFSGQPILDYIKKIILLEVKINA